MAGDANDGLNVDITKTLNTRNYIYNIFLLLNYFRKKSRSFSRNIVRILGFDSV